MVNAGVGPAHLDLIFLPAMTVNCYLNSQFRSFPNAYPCQFITDALPQVFPSHLVL